MERRRLSPPRPRATPSTGGSRPRRCYGQVPGDVRHSQRVRRVRGGLRPDRRPHWSRWCTGLAAALPIISVVKGTRTPFAMLIALFGGFGAAWPVAGRSALPRRGRARPNSSPGSSSRGVDIAASVSPAASLATAPATRPAVVSHPARPPCGVGELPNGTLIEAELADGDTAARAGPAANGDGPAAAECGLAVSCSAPAPSWNGSPGQHCGTAAGVLSPMVLLLDQTPWE